ncbi:hypothetical protein Micbo1qcDRAFT_178685 [Microdochium bolleyi]|uniref:Uncharacterized protein n=1 Tax=Microdochium bolleyi TaxID=196109 RepID=A0A136ISV8_9PEZI|nr:hypothetical protein Micbo1qcDRAFT_178685 [Microdochium bolleyi]
MAGFSISFDAHRPSKSTSGEQKFGALVSLKAPQAGHNEWVAEQLEVSSGLSLNDDRSKKELDWAHGPVKITGYINTDTFELGLSPVIAGISTGNVYGDLRQNVELRINLATTQGTTRFYLKNGNELWISVDVKVNFGGNTVGDYKIISL